MAAPLHIKADLIIGMTLAEMFLLILFVVWYSQGAGAGSEWERIAKERQAKVDELQKKVQLQQSKVEELERIRDWWRRNFGVDPPASIAELETALRTPQGQQVRQDMARGAPRCDQNNVLIEVSIQHGTAQVRLRDASPRLEAWTRSVRIRVPSTGNVLTGQQEIGALLGTVSRFYEQQSQQKQPCRFDYKFIWATDEDYRRGRETFEKYFYPAGISAAAALQPASQ